MANRLFETGDFWDRVALAIKVSGKTKMGLAKELGVSRKYFTPSSSSNGRNRSWHTGVAADFCKATGVSADWLLGLTNDMAPVSKGADSFSFTVIDTTTGKEPIFDHNHLFKEQWFKDSHLIWCDIEGWCLSEDGVLILVDECGNFAYAPDKYKVIMK